MQPCPSPHACWSGLLWWHPSTARKLPSAATDCSSSLPRHVSTKGTFFLSNMTLLQLIEGSLQSWFRVLEMEPDVQRLLLFLIFRLTMFSALETMSTDVVWHSQQLCSMALALQGLMRLRGRQQRRLWAQERGLHQPGFFYQNLLGSFNAREFKGRMRMTSPLLSICAVFSYRCYKGEIRQCGWPFRFKSRLPYP